MEEQMSLQQMTEEISNKLLETKSVLDIIEELTDEDAKCTFCYRRQLGI